MGSGAEKTQLDVYAACAALEEGSKKITRVTRLFEM
jgi:hypothetical protein